MGRLNRLRFLGVSALAFVVCALAGGRSSAQSDPLPSWNDGAARQAIVEFVQATTADDKAGEPDGFHLMIGRRPHAAWQLDR